MRLEELWIPGVFTIEIPCSAIPVCSTLRTIELCQTLRA